MLKSLRALLLLVSAVSATAEIRLPGYEFIRITDTPRIEWYPRLNDLGDVVFCERFGDPLDDYTDEIMLFRKGQLDRLTDDLIADRYPTIANDGTVAWSRAAGPDYLYGPSLEIARLRNGNADYITSDALDDYAPLVERYDDIAWFKTRYEGCESDVNISNIYWWRDGETVQITDTELSDQLHGRNSRGDFVWTRYNLCVDPWLSDNWGYLDGELVNLTTDEYDQTQAPTINDQGTILWTYNSDGAGLSKLMKLENGVVQPFADGDFPKLNNHGDVLFSLWDEDLAAYQKIVYLRGEFHRLTNETGFNANGDINDRTDMVWMNKGYPEYDIVMLKRLPFGDMNCDKAVDFADIDGFVVALVSGKDAFGEQFPDCDWWLADMNDDRSIDFNDLDPFITCLIDGGCERP